MSVELQDWKAAIRDSVADYLLNPCLKTAKVMLLTALLWHGQGAESQAGVILAVIEESRRIGLDFGGPAFWGYRFFFGLGRLMTLRAPTWNDYYALRWTFRQESEVVEVLHSRIHSRRAEARENAKDTVFRMFADAEFRSAWLSMAGDADCGVCCSAVFVIRKGRGFCPIMWVNLGWGQPEHGPKCRNLDRRNTGAREMRHDDFLGSPSVFCNCRGQVLRSVFEPEVRGGDGFRNRRLGSRRFRCRILSR